MSVHFIQRVEERAPGLCDPQWLADEIRAAIIGDGREWIVRIQAARLGTGLYRLLMHDGSYYAIANDTTGRAITFLRQEDVTAMKASIRGKASSVKAWKARQMCRELKRERSHILKRKDR